MEFRLSHSCVVYRNGFLWEWGCKEFDIAACAKCLFASEMRADMEPGCGGHDKIVDALDKALGN
jgi:hypothetical protein